MENTDMIKDLIEAQKEIESVEKKAENPYFKSKYADLNAVIEAVKDPLNKHGFVILQKVMCGERGPYVETQLIHTSGDCISSQTPIYCVKQNDPQAFGSGVTYARRYGLQSLLTLSAEDDDGNKAAQKNRKKDYRDPEGDEMSVVKMIYDKLLDSASDKGLSLSFEKLCRFIFSFKGKYPSDENVVGPTVAFIINSGIEKLCSEAA
jgi:hypothetical protein